MIKRFFQWIDDKNTREKITFVIGGLAAVVTAIWTGLNFLLKDRVEVKSPTPATQVAPAPTIAPTSVTVAEKITATHLVCRGFFQTGCEPHDNFIGCDISMSEWAQQKCGTFQIKTLRRYEGGLCGYHMAEVSCTGK